MAPVRIAVRDADWLSYLSLVVAAATSHGGTLASHGDPDRGRDPSAPLAELTARSRSALIVRTPAADRLLVELTRRGIDAAVTGPDQVTSTGTTPETVGRVIGTIGLVIYEMRLEESNLEDVFFSLTSTEGALS